MFIINAGTLSFSRPLTKSEADYISCIINPCTAREGMNEVEIEELRGSGFDSRIKEIVDYLKPHGVKVDGQVSYFGDYSGEYVVTDGRIEEEQPRYLRDIPDDELEKELKHRKGVSYCNSVGSRIWYGEVWTVDDIIDNLPEGVEATPENIEKGIKAAAHIFDDKSSRNEMLADTLENVDYDC